MQITRASPVLTLNKQCSTHIGGQYDEISHDTRDGGSGTDISKWFLDVRGTCPVTPVCGLQGSVCVVRSGPVLATVMSL